MTRLPRVHPARPRRGAHQPRPDRGRASAPPRRRLAVDRRPLVRRPPALGRRGSGPPQRIGRPAVEAELHLRGAGPTHDGAHGVPGRPGRSHPVRSRGCPSRHRHDPGADLARGRSGLVRRHTRPARGDSGAATRWCRGHRRGGSGHQPLHGAHAEPTGDELPDQRRRSGADGGGRHLSRPARAKVAGRALERAPRRRWPDPAGRGRQGVVREPERPVRLPPARALGPPRRARTWAR